MWYHLSKEPWGSDAITELRSPNEDRSFGEPAAARLSVAPTVCQALLGVPEYHENEPSLLIYEVGVQDPVPAPTIDFELTHEHCITQDVLDRHDGCIPIRLVGKTTWNKEMRLTILHAIQTEAMTYNGVIEKDKLWEIAGDEWHPRFDVLGSIEDALAK